MRRQILLHEIVHRDGTAYQTSNNGPEIEDHPEPGDVPTLRSFLGVTHNDGPLCCPE